MSNPKQLTAKQVMKLLKDGDPEHLVFAKLGDKSYPIGWALASDNGGIELDIEPDVRFAPTAEAVWNTLEVEVGPTQGRQPLWISNHGRYYKVMGLKKFLSRLTFQTKEATE